MMEYINLILSQWSFFAAAAVLYAINESIKKTFPSPNERKVHAFFWATLPLWPILLGGIFGYLKGSPLPAQVKDFGKLAGVVYFSAAGAFAINARDIFRTYCKFMKPEYYAKLSKEDSTASVETIAEIKN